MTGSPSTTASAYTATCQGPGVPGGRGSACAGRGGRNPPRWTVSTNAAGSSGPEAGPEPAVKTTTDCAPVGALASGAAPGRAPARAGAEVGRVGHARVDGRVADRRRARPRRSTACSSRRRAAGGGRPRGRGPSTSTQSPSSDARPRPARAGCRAGTGSGRAVRTTLTSPRAGSTQRSATRPSGSAVTVGASSGGTGVCGWAVTNTPREAVARPSGVR